MLIKAYTKFLTPTFFNNNLQAGGGSTMNFSLQNSYIVKRTCDKNIEISPTAKHDASFAKLSEPTLE